MSKRANQLALTAILLSLNLIAIPAQAASATRSSSFAYDPVSGLLTKEIIEPGNSQLCLVTEYTYDAFGNKTSATTRNCNGSAGEAAAPAAGSDAVIIPRTSSSTYTDATDNTGRFALTSTNALGHTESRTYDARFGTVKSLTGPNGLITSWDYDTFGRKTLETRADTTTTTWTYSQPCDLANGNLPNAKYCIASISSGEGQATRTYYDSLSRKLATTRSDFTNALWIDEGHVDYDAMGRVAKSYLPYVQGSFTTAKFSTFIYDDLGRVIIETAPDLSTISRTYAGLTSSETNALSQTKTTVKNSQGQTVTITDAANKTISYTYDPFGNLVKTTDALGNVTTLIYDARGRKTGMVDPDMGTWSYAYNALGELIRQVDAKAQTVTMQYDKLGRMTSRSEFDLISNWVYDTAAKGIGKLASATSSNGYSRTHFYDTWGRLSSTGTIIDNNAAAPYMTRTTYDSVGRPLVQTYPASPTHPAGFAVKNIYNTAGYLEKVVNNDNPNFIYWTANTMDASGHITAQTYGNGVVTTQVYDPATGRITQQLAGAGNAVQNMSYQYDTLGNLQTRTDVNSNLTETFGYDNLNRVTVATATSGAINTATTYAYDAIGNIVCKSDISACSQAAPNYTYNASGLNSIHPHAVSGITGTVYGVVNPTFDYDANGNMKAEYENGNVNAAVRTITWTSFNMPGQITRGTKTASFLYNPEHERTKELQADGSIVITLSPRYDTGLHFEKKYESDPVTHALTGAVEYEYYLYAGGLMFGKYITTVGANGATTSTSVEYYTKDHLGSIVAITRSNSGIVDRLSYDVWGKRRQPNGVADPLGLLNNPDMYHGYTGHEMLDDVGLIHMNGRLYDPIMGRFVSADPTIQAPGNLQSYNRYTYGWNNPLSGWDPSGYSWWTEKGRPFLKIVVAVAIAVYAPQIAGMIASGAAQIGMTATVGLSTSGVTLTGAQAFYGAAVLLSKSAYNDTQGKPSMSGIPDFTASASGNTDACSSCSPAYDVKNDPANMEKGFPTGRGTYPMQNLPSVSSMLDNVPDNLGFGAYERNWSANIAIGVVREGLKGIVKTRSVDGFSQEAEKQAIKQLAVHTLGFALSDSGTLPSFQNGVFTYGGSTNELGRKVGGRQIDNIIIGP